MQARERLVHEKEVLRLKAAAEGAERDKQRIEDRARLMQHVSAQHGVWSVWCRVWRVEC